MIFKTLGCFPVALKFPRKSIISRYSIFRQMLTWLTSVRKQWQVITTDSSQCWLRLQTVLLNVALLLPPALLRFRAIRRAKLLCPFTRASRTLHVSSNCLTVRETPCLDGATRTENIRRQCFSATTQSAEK